MNMRPNIHLGTIVPRLQCAQKFKMTEGLYRYHPYIKLIRKTIPHILSEGKTVNVQL